jgi:5-(carboxyamino)imidazole ribonucleotide synthase
VIENEHANHILDVSFAPAIVSEKVFTEAVEIARSIAETFDYIGTMCVEFFLAADGRIIVNEIAPRPHNSGHLTFGPCATSQFEQQLRAVCGLPLGSAEFFRPAAIANLLGDMWQNGEPKWTAALEAPNVSVHLYGKLEPRPGRKMGHLTATADSGLAAAEVIRNARNALGG